MRYESWRHARGVMERRKKSRLSIPVAHQELQTLKGVDYPFPTDHHDEPYPPFGANETRARGGWRADVGYIRPRPVFLHINGGRMGIVSVHNARPAKIYL